MTQVKTEIARALADAGLGRPSPTEEESLWEYFHRRNGGLHTQAADALIPVLAIDQFEEIFTVGADKQDGNKLAEFLSELSDLVENRPPEALEDSLSRNPEEAGFFDFSRALLACS
jgi:hypothetical protein